MKEAVERFKEQNSSLLVMDGAFPQSKYTAGKDDSRSFLEVFTK